MFNGQENIIAKKNSETFEVSLLKTQMNKDSIAIVQNIFPLEETEDGAIIRYTISKDAIFFNEAIQSSSTNLEKLQLAEKLRQLLPLRNKFKVPFLHPDNLYLVGEELFVVHFGLEEMVVPKKYDEALFLSNLKALVLSIFHPKLSYEKLLNGSLSLKDKFSQVVLQAKTAEEIFIFLEERIVKEKVKIQETKRVVGRNQYAFYRFIGVISLILALVMGFFFYQYKSENEKQNAIITAQTSFLTNNYAKTQKDLEKYDLSSLPQSAKYILAVSSVNLSDLTGNQKQAILNTLSIKSDDNTLNYWGNIGRGNFDKALDLAQNLGDDQLTLLAYTDLYQATKLNTKMAGAKKQELLEEYTKQIEELTKKLGK
ncbi:type VII secretion protein EssB [Enterococcus sp. AZ050]|uniref:type VII secretion protein EssB n=1 Tax=Enterococcus sp. AZ050 TaxID=2774696 RepID=UPI003F21798D